MRDTTEQSTQSSQLTSGDNWDKHDKRTEKAAKIFQDHIADEGRGPKLKRQQKGGKKWLVILAVLVSLAVVGGVVYWFFLREPSDTETSTQQNTEQPTEAQTSALSSGKTETYDSSRYFLSFDYPDSWDVDETDPTALTVTSPVVSLQASTGTEQQGKVTMKIRAKNTTLAEFEAGDATATKQSELITYTKPTQAQRASTYLSFAAFAGATKGLDALLITGDYGYQAGQAVLKTEISQIDPIISVTFDACADSGCSEVTPMTLSLDQWSDPSFAGVIKAMLQSIAIN